MIQRHAYASFSDRPVSRQPCREFEGRESTAHLRSRRADGVSCLPFNNEDVNSVVPSFAIGARMPSIWFLHLVVRLP